MIEFNCNNVNSERIGDEHGINTTEAFNLYEEKINNILKKFKEQKDLPGSVYCWMNIHKDTETVNDIREYAKMTENKFENILVIATGGSAFGAKAILEALLKPYWNTRTREQRGSRPRIHILDNIDPDVVKGLTDIQDLKRTLIITSSKSGQSSVIMSMMMVAKKYLETIIGDNHRLHMVCCTESINGLLSQLAQQEGYKIFPIRRGLTTRFAVASCMGLLPLAMAGINTDELLAGFGDMTELLLNSGIHENTAAQNALIHYLADTEHGKKISVMMPYSARLKYFPDWYRQLWADSLGKTKIEGGKHIYTGQTPLKAIGCTDQFSLLQLMTEGPNDKITTFIRIKDFDNTVVIPEIFEHTGAAYLGGTSVNSLINAEADGVRVALTDKQRPNVTLTIPSINPYNIGQLFCLMHFQTAIAAELYGINAYEEPGIEPIKDYIYALLNRPGYEGTKEEIQQKLESGY